MKYPLILLLCCCCITFVLAQDKPWQYLGNDSVSQVYVMKQDIKGNYWGFIHYRNNFFKQRYYLTFGISNNGYDFLPYVKTPDSSMALVMLQLPDKKVLFGARSSSGYAVVHQTTDFGKSWSLNAKLPSGFPPQTISMDKRGIIYIGIADGLLLRSSDLGETWNYLHHPNQANNAVESILFDGDNSLYVKTGGGFSNHSISRSTNYGQTWLRLDSLLFSYTNLLDVRYYNCLLIAHNRLYVTGSYFDSTLRRQNRLLRCSYNGTNVEDLIRGTNDDDTNRVPMSSIVDSSGVLYGLGNSICRSIDSGRTWQRNAYISSRVEDSFTQRIWDTVNIAELLSSDKLTIMLDGHLHLGHFHYRSRDTVKYIPPQRIASMNRCGYATATFIADTLTSVEFIQAASMNVTVRYDTIVPRRSIQVHVNVIDTSQYAHFLFRATTHKGHKTEWGDDIFPRVQQTELQQRKGKSIKVPDSLDAGLAISYVWYRDGKKIGYFGSQTYLRYERVLELDTPGTYWCEIFDTTGCVQTTAPYTYNPVSVTDDVDEHIRVFPNPANESITITGAHEVTGDIEITDVLGNVLLVSGARHSAATGIVKIDILQLPTGVYGIRIPTLSGIYRTRFVVAR